MGIIFPTDAENPNQNPDYKSIPSPAAEAAKPTTFAVAAVLASSLPLCPEVHEHNAHLPHIEFHQGHELPAWAFLPSGFASISSI